MKMRKVFLIFCHLISYSIEECEKTQFLPSSRKHGKCCSTSPTSPSSGGVQMGNPLESWMNPPSPLSSSPNISNIPTSPPSSGRYFFLTQLNMYNFHKRKNPEGVQFYHQLFRKGQRYVPSYPGSCSLEYAASQVRPKFYRARNSFVDQPPSVSRVPLLQLRKQQS